MKIILVGAGTIGKSIVFNLVKEEHDIIVIDSNPAKITQIINSFDIRGLVGDGTDKAILKEANVNSCDLFISTTSSDEQNIVSCLIAKRLGAKNTIARVRMPHYNSETSILEDLGINMLINPEKETAEEIFKMISIPSAMQIDSFDNDINIFEFAVAENNNLIGRQLKDIRREFDSNILFVSINRNNNIFIPRGEDEIEENDKVSVIATKEDMVEFMYYINSKRKALKNFLIIGGGNTSIYLLSKLNKPRYNTKVIEIDKEVCEKLSETFDKCQIINGDGTNIDTLINQGIDNCDAVIALAPLDEENLISAVFASSRNVNKVILRQNRTNISEMIEQTKFASVVTPKQIIADKIVSYARQLGNPHGSNVIKMHKIVDEQLEAIEFHINKDCEFIDKEIKDLKIKEDCIIATIIKNGEAVIPTGRNKIKLDDNVIVVSKTSLSDVNDILK